MLSQNTFHHDANLCSSILSFRPVDGDTPFDGVDQLLSDPLQFLITQDLHGAFVGSQSVIERDFVVCQPEGFSAFPRLFHLFGNLDQLFDHLGGLDRTVLIFPERLLEHFGKRPSLDDVAPHAHLDFVVDQLLEQFQSQIALRKLAYFGKKLVRENRNVRLIQTGGCEDVHNFGR